LILSVSASGQHRSANKHGGGGGLDPDQPLARLLTPLPAFGSKKQINGLQ
jgi:hypothetical protein